ncbi:MAG: inositol monophosphatase [Candidatus Latescibacterota bacterium]|nr:MAG: inositol monophosphatase [Candidatus Latescibacterota bacterium]
MRDRRDAARRAALAAGAFLRERFERGFAGEIAEKGRNDFVTAYDTGSEAIIRGILTAAFPGVGLFAEESAAAVAGDPFWIVDPLDGTTNFIHGYQAVAVSIALWERGDVVLGCAYDPLRNELFEAERGGGATLNGAPIRVSNETAIERCLLGTGFPFSAPAHIGPYLGTFRDLFGLCRDIRRAGAAVLDLCHVACGRLDGFWELYLKPWDTAAGALIVREAGGATSDFFGDSGFLESGNIVAGPAAIHGRIVEVTRRHFTPAGVAGLATHFIGR